MMIPSKHLYLAFLTATIALACSGEDTAADDSSEPGDNAVTDNGIGFVNSASHDDPVDTPNETSWVTPVTGDSNDALVRVLLTDAPADAEKVLVQICGIDVEKKALTAAGDSSGSAWHRVSTQCQAVDLLSLQNGVTEAMGIGELPPGEYSRIRLMVQDASMVRDGIEEPLALSNEGKDAGFMISSQFSVGEGDATTITVDFDAGESIKESVGGGYELRPALSVVSVQTRARVRLCDGTGGATGAGNGTAQGGGVGGATGAGDGTAQGGGDGADGANGQGTVPAGGSAGAVSAGSSPGGASNQAEPVGTTVGKA